MRTLAIAAAAAAGLLCLGCGGNSETVKDGDGGAGAGPAAAAGLPWPAKEVADAIEDLSAPEWEIRGAAVRKVSEAGRWIVPFLMVALKNRDPMTRMEAAYCVGRIGDPAAVPSLVEVLQESPPYDQTIYLADALGALGDPKAIPALRPLLDYTVEREVYGREVGPVELKMMESREATVRQAGAEALARLGDTSGFPLLIEGLKGNGWVRRDAAVRLNRLTGGKVDFGFYLDMPQSGVEKVVESWNDWWAKNKAAFKAEPGQFREAYDVYQPRKK